MLAKRAGQEMKRRMATPFLFASPFVGKSSCFLFSFVPTRCIRFGLYTRREGKGVSALLAKTNRYSALLKSLCNNRAKTHRLASEEPRAHKLPWATCSHKHKENGPSKQQSLVELKGFSHVYVLLGQPFLSSPLSSSLEPLCPQHQHRFCRLGLHKLQGLVVLSWLVMKGCPGCGTAK